METNLNVDSYINNAKNINQIVINDSKLSQIIINGASNNEFVSRIKYSNFRLYSSNDDMNYKLLYYKSEYENNKEVSFEDFKEALEKLDKETLNNVLSCAMSFDKAKEIYYGMDKEIDEIDINSKELKELEDIHNNIFMNVNKNIKVSKEEKNAYDNEINQIADGNSLSDSYKYKKYGDLSVNSFKVGLKMYQDLSKVNNEHKTSLVWRLKSVFEGPEKLENQILKKMETNLLKVDFVSKDELNSIKGLNSVFDSNYTFDELINKSRCANLFNDYYKFKMEEEKQNDINSKALINNNDNVIREKMDIFEELSKEDKLDLEDVNELGVNDKNIELNNNLDRGGI